MTTPVFADTAYYVALTNPRDQYAAAAADWTVGFDGEMVTTAWILTEVANFLAATPANRSLFLALLQDLQGDSRVEIVPPSLDLFEQGVELFAHRPDKQWSLTDCISFVVMRRHQLTDALTGDHHFEQAGFTILLK